MTQPPFDPHQPQPHQQPGSFDPAGPAAPTAAYGHPGGVPAAEVSAGPASQSNVGSAPAWESSAPQDAVPPSYGAPNPAPAVSNKSFVATWLLSYFLGGIGVDRFYLGKVGTGIVKLLTFGGFGIWWLIDLIMVLAGATRDRNGLPLAGYQENRKIAWMVTAGLVVLSLIFGACSGAGAAGSATVASNAVEAEAPPAADEAPADDAVIEEEEEEAPVEDADGGAADWADDTFGTFETITESGSGDSIIDLPEGAEAGLVTASHSGDANFILSVLDDGNQPSGDLLVNTIGSYEGSTAYGLMALGEGTSIEVTASGSWDITIEPLSSAPDMAGEGEGDAVFLYDGDAAQLSATHGGDGNFIVYQETDSFSMGLLINEIGAYEGTVPMVAGPSVVLVKADGDWTLSID